MVQDDGPVCAFTKELRWTTTVRQVITRLMKADPVEHSEWRWLAQAPTLYAELAQAKP